MVSIWRLNQNIQYLIHHHFSMGPPGPLQTNTIGWFRRLRIYWEWLSQWLPNKVNNLSIYQIQDLFNCPSCPLSTSCPHTQWSTSCWTCHRSTCRASWWEGQRLASPSMGCLHLIVYSVNSFICSYLLCHKESHHHEDTYPWCWQCPQEEIPPSWCSWREG